MKRFKDILIWSGVFAVLFGLLSFANIMHDKEVCKQVVINVDQNNDNKFVSSDDIEILIHNRNGVIKGKELRVIDTHNIEAKVQNNPYVKNTEVYKTINGKVNIRVNQRTPIVRVITKNNSSFYIDVDNRIMPLSNKFSARILLVNGNISIEEANRSVANNNQVIKGSKLDEIYRLSKFIHQSKFFKAQIEQVYVNENGEYEMVPKVGRHIILFGEAKDISNKFEKLETFYKKGTKQVGWDKYSLVNLKFYNQIVCTKK